MNDSNGERIRSALRATADGDFAAAASNLLGELGYRSERVLPSQTGDAADFARHFPADNPDTQSERDFLEQAASVRILFQFTDAEISATAQQDLFAGGEFDKSNAQSFLFTAVELRGDDYPRSRYAAFTRECNKRFTHPMLVLFRANGGKITLAFVHRRANLRNPDRDVLGSVSLIRQIDPAQPHRAHLDILSDLRLDARIQWLDARAKPPNFDGLLDAWLDALDTEELNRRFYRDLFEWFERAVETAKFPAGERMPTPQEHIIRLITRLLFVWFIKEKGLAADELFIENQVAELLRDYDRHAGDSYYRAALQNLFFATLNTEIDKRRFSDKTQNDHRNFSAYRYRDQIADPDRLLRLFERTPFINGGLFDCLDSFDAVNQGGVRVDCFTDNPNQRKGYSIPNRLFFGDHAAPGLIDLFNRYRFTVEENTPAEREVALDPELLGKVFENLLAAVNPETSLTARKETGSYYTPRPVVDYMVDEALVGALTDKAQPESQNAPHAWSARLRYLLDYDDAFVDADALFSETERVSVVKAIAELKALDPAVGSGAFPMGILHKLTLALRRLDPDNAIWESVQREHARSRADEAFDTDDRAARDAELAEISDTFERYRDSDYGRKLYLIQNCIYGVDIQPIAAQIAKLRFFISLAIEQQPDGDAANNYGVKPLPNLETRFVAANALLRLERPPQMSLGQTDAVTRLEREIALNRERHFHANARSAKLELRRSDARLRHKLADELQNDGFPAASARQLADWEPFDQNAPAADWFDAGYMFGVHDGFDIVIGNPPYVRSEVGDANRELRNRIIVSGQYQTLYEKWDLFIPFIERGYQLIREGGITTLIVSDAYCHARYARKSQEWFLKNSRILRLDFFGKIQLFQAGVHNVTYMFQKADGRRNKPERRVHYPEFGSVNLLPTDEQRNLTHRVFFPEDIEAQAFSTPTLPLSQICYISYGLRPSSKPKAVDKFVTADLTSDICDEIHCKPYVDGKHLDYWLPANNLWLEWGTERSPSQFYAPTFPELYEVNEKLLLQKNAGANPKACYDELQFVFSASVIGAIPWHKLSGVRNNSIRKQARYEDEKQNPKLPSREMLESTSIRFDAKFLLGVLNSSAAINFILANRRHNVSIYPDDWKNVPIPDVALEEQAPLADVVDKILAAKRADAAADTRELQWRLDELVYALYGLTAAESTAIERSLGLIHATDEGEDGALGRAMAAALAEPGARVGMDEIRRILRGQDGA